MRRRRGRRRGSENKTRAAAATEEDRRDWHTAASVGKFPRVTREGVVKIGQGHTKTPSSN